MRLTGLPLILLAAGLAVLTAAATVRFWRISRPWRLPVRAAGLVLIEALVVVTVGLIVNRSDNFYPSWQSLTGDLDTVTQTAPPPAGRLDGELAAAHAGLPWSPHGNAAWRLAGPPTLIAPSGYEEGADRTFPVIIALAAADQAPAIRAQASAIAGVLTLVVTPTPATLVTDLATLPGQLQHDARVTGRGWAIVPDARFAKLAEQWRKAAPDRFRAVTVIDPHHPGTALDSAARQLPAPLTAPLRLPS